MKINILKARIKRNNFVNHAGQSFVDENSKIIIDLKNEGENALVGIQKSDKTYTVLGDKLVYYSSISGTKGRLPLNVFSNILHENAVRKGKFLARYNYVKIDNEKIWTKNKATMTALLNTIMWLEKEENNNASNEGHV